MSAQPYNSALHKFAVLTAAATLALIGIGGLVTSHGAGMAVPDWPTSYGYNMFLFPIAKWWRVGNIFYEHSHRLFASAVGLLTAVLMLWLFGRKAQPAVRWFGVILYVAGIAVLTRPAGWMAGSFYGATGLIMFGAGFVWPGCKCSPKWLRRLGVAAFLAVVLQGILGGLRVVLFKDQIGIFHAALAQLFFVLVCSIALFTSRWWMKNVRPHPGPLPQERENYSQSCSELQALHSSPRIETTKKSANESTLSEFSSDSALVTLSSGERAGVRAGVFSDHRFFRQFVLATTLLIFLQLILGATMRHQHAGLAIPDFPLAYGKLWPATDAASVAHYNAQRIEVLAANPITASQIILQMLHRVVAAVILVCVSVVAWRTRWSSRFSVSGGADSLKAGLQRRAIGRLALAWLGLIAGQVVLGVATIWSNKAADIATAHVLAGALSLATGAMICLISFRRFGPAHDSERTADISSAVLSAGRMRAAR